MARESEPRVLLARDGAVLGVARALAPCGLDAISSPSSSERHVVVKHPPHDRWLIELGGPLAYPLNDRDSFDITLLALPARAAAAGSRHGSPAPCASGRGLAMTVHSMAFRAAPWSARDRRRSCRERARPIHRLIEEDCPTGMVCSSCYNSSLVRKCGRQLSPPTPTPV